MPLRRDRREVLGASLVATLLSPCAAPRAFAQVQAAAEAPPFLGALEAQQWQGPRWGGQETGVVVLTPRERPAGRRWPMLVALHGLGEARRGPIRGAWGWVRDYDLARADEALRRGVLTREDFRGLVSAERLAALNLSLRSVPYEGLVIVLPYTPDILRQPGDAAHQAYDHWLARTLVRRAQRELCVIADRSSTGIDGVSLGGLHSLWTGLGHPEVFGVVGAMQAAVRRRQALVLANRRRARRGTSVRVRLVTSTRDVLREDVLALDRMMTARQIPHDLRLIEGPHDYIFNQGPGAVEMLLFHERALRGIEPV
ncbi:MAG: alpha/beta hydrolase-fold protein [Deltaproteobacteria bacterium]|nr:alpha/beta hydrolase-fold protein [Deltaproteobacteria bacterium]